MRITAPELVRLALAHTGASGPTELADELGLEGRHAPQKISRWIAGTHEPDFEATLLLLERAGMLRASPTRRRARDTATLADDDLAELIETATSLLRKLEHLANQPPLPQAGATA